MWRLCFVPQSLVASFCSEQLELILCNSFIICCSVWDTQTTELLVIFKWKWQKKCHYQQCLKATLWGNASFSYITTKTNIKQVQKCKINNLTLAILLTLHQQQVGSASVDGFNLVKLIFTLLPLARSLSLFSSYLLLSTSSSVLSPLSWCL